MYTSNVLVVNAVKMFATIHNIPLDKIAIGGGAAMMLMGQRSATEDLNLWIDHPHFDELARKKGTLIHPMRDTFITIPEVNVYVRKRNRYFKSVEIEGVQVFDVLALIIQKRGGHAEHKRPSGKRDQDALDLQYLAALHAQSNKVSA